MENDYDMEEGDMENDCDMEEHDIEGDLANDIVGKSDNSNRTSIRLLLSVTTTTTTMATKIIRSLLRTLDD